MGLLSYLFMMPTFINIMQIYAMCNLHDISWGNRPTTQAQGVEAVTFNAAAQEKLRQDYQLFRAYFLYFWLISNALFGGLSEYLTSSSNQQTINDGNIRFIDGFALFVAGLVVFKFIFALIYTLKWNFRNCFKSSKYGKNKVDIAEEFRKLKQARNGAYSTDEDDDDDATGGVDMESHALKSSLNHNNQIFEKDQRGDIVGYKENKDIDDSDNDDMEFDDPVEEEQEDILQSSMRKSSKRVAGGGVGFMNISKVQQ